MASMSNEEMSRQLRSLGYFVPECSIVLWEKKFQREPVERWLNHMQGNLRFVRRPFILESYVLIQPKRSKLVKPVLPQPRGPRLVIRSSAPSSGGSVTGWTSRNAVLK